MQFFNLNAATGLTVAAVIAQCAILFSSCSDEKDLSIDKNEEYTRKFIKEFGIYDSSHDWNTSTRYKVTLAQVPDGASTVTVYTAQPGTPGCRTVAQFPASVQSFSFDMDKGSEYAYAEFCDADGRIVSGGNFSLKSSTPVIGGRASRAEEPECTATIGDGIRPDNVVSAEPWRFPDNIQQFWKGLIGEERFNEAASTQTPIKATEIFKTYMIDGKQTSQGTPQDMRYMVNLFSKSTGTFGEGICNVTKFREKLHPEDGVEYVMAEDGPVTLSYFYGATAYHNKLGYLYYKDGATDEEIMHAPRFIIIDDADPDKNIFHGTDPVNPGTSTFTGGMHPSSIIDYYEQYLNGNEGANWVKDFKFVTGTKHHLVYFGEGTEFEKGHPGSYTFPAGTHIVFFIIKNLYEENIPWKRSYSLPRLNEIMNYTTQHSGQCHLQLTPSEVSIPAEAQFTEPNADFVTYDWYGYTMMGIEDGTDHDANDMMFFVNANIRHDKIVDITDDTPKPQSWILAVEDLGNIGDFDFNDLVVEISHVSGSNTASVKPLAAGGTLPIRLFYHNDDSHIGADRNLSHINEWFGTDSWTQPINASVYTLDSQTVDITVGDDFTMSSSPFVIEDNRMGGFYVKVNHDPAQGFWTQGVVDIAAPQQGNVPQMLCLPGDWAWPAEGINIRDAYPAIGAWITDRNANTDWHQHPQTGLTVRHKR